MSTLFGLFYTPLTKKLTVRNVDVDKNKTESKKENKTESKKENKSESKSETKNNPKTESKTNSNTNSSQHIQITVEYLSQMFIF